MKNKIILVALLAAFAIAAADAIALGVTDGTFGGAASVQQGGTYSASVLLTNSPNRDNHFVVSVGGDIGGWVTGISPADFNLSAGAKIFITLFALVPANATVGTHTGTITVTGTQIIGGGSVNYQEATKGTLWADVIKSSSPAAGGIYCASDVKQCPDGSYVSRNPGANCAFYACPNISAVQANITPSNQPAGNDSIIVLPNSSINVSVGGSGNMTISAASNASASVSVNNTISASPGGNASASVSVTPIGGNGSSITVISVANNQTNVISEISAANNSGAGSRASANATNVPASIFWLNISILKNPGEDKGTMETAFASAEYTGNLQSEGPAIFMETSAGKKQIIIMPEDAIGISGAANDGPVRVELKEKSRKPVYSVIGTKKAKLLFFIPVSMNIETDVDAETGEIISVSRPWWSVLAGG